MELWQCMELWQWARCPRLAATLTLERSCPHRSICGAQIAHYGIQRAFATIGFISPVGNSQSASSSGWEPVAAPPRRSQSKGKVQHLSGRQAHSHQGVAQSDSRLGANGPRTEEELLEAETYRPPRF
ncbi:hypothetical protein H920_12784 [Fukomys damarensis]|uniref:Uncharacterized protein n=1 Tax=Fukomys damarensis TaxID=885580 RepID=A0A091DSU4_FUKDA|nr:hypothetical protein H920_12784 [Fukomys damarensis]